MGRFLLVAAAIAAAAAASCYEPSLVDCADTCGTSGLCPDGLTCISGYCRTAGATGACTTGGHDARPGSDAAGGACPMAPQGQGTPTCGNAHPAAPAAPQCYVACGTPVMGANVAAFSVNSWKPAAITSSTDETAAAGVAGSGETWLGLVAGSGSGASAGAWHWVAGPPPPLPYMHWAPGEPVDQGSAGNCGALTGSGWISQPCTKSLPFLIASPPPP